MRTLSLVGKEPPNVPLFAHPAPLIVIINPLPSLRALGVVIAGLTHNIFPSRHCGLDPKSPYIVIIDEIAARRPQ